MNQIEQNSLNVGIFDFLNTLDIKDLQNFFITKQPKDLNFMDTFDFKTVLKARDELDFSKASDEFLDKIIMFDFNEKSKFGDINIKIVIMVIFIKFQRYIQNNDITKNQICKFNSFAASYKDDRIYKFLSFQICKNAISYFLQTKANSFYNPFSAITLLDFLQSDLNENFKNEFDINGISFSYFDEYNKRNSDYDNTESADLVFFNRFIKDTDLEQICDLSKEIELFSLNEFLNDNNLNSDFSTLSIFVQENEEENKQETTKTDNKIYKFITKMKKIIKK